MTSVSDILTTRIELFYGIKFDVRYTNLITDILYSVHLNELIVNGYKMFDLDCITFEKPEDCNYGYIYFDCLHMKSARNEDPRDSTLIFEPKILLRLYNRHINRVKYLTDLYLLIVERYKKEKVDLNTDNLYLGWSIMNV